MDFVVVGIAAVAGAGLGAFAYREYLKYQSKVNAVISGGIADVDGAVNHVKSVVATHVAAFEAAVVSKIAGK